MAFEYFKVYLKDLPDSVLRTKGKAKVLHLRIASINGQVEIEFKNGDVIRTDDWKTIHSLKTYRIPRMGIKHKPKGESLFRHVYHDHTEYAKVKVFKKTKATDKFAHEVKA